MKLFVLGSSRTGKTPFARMVAQTLGLHHIMASDWVRRLFPDGTAYPDRESFLQALTRFSLEELRRRPSACVEYIRNHHDLSQPTVIEGVRNPHDFVHLFDPRTDHVVFLEHSQNEQTQTPIEGGLLLIGDYLDYLEKTGLLPCETPQVWRYRFAEFYDPPGAGSERVVESEGVRRVASLDAAAHDFLLQAAMWTDRQTAQLPEADFAGGPMFVHAEIPPLKIEVRSDFLYDLQPGQEVEHLPCTAFAVSSYPGQALTFKILLADGSLFSSIPPTALVDRSKDAERILLELKDLVDENSASGDICVSRFRTLEGPVQAYFQHRELWLAGEYWCTIDWYTGDGLMHLLVLENGQPAFVPSHKVRFKDGERRPPKRRKAHAKWHV